MLWQRQQIYRDKWRHTKPSRTVSIKQSNSISYDNNYFWSVLPGIMGIKSTCSWIKWQNHPWPLTTTPVSHLKRQPGSRWHSSSAFTMPMDILSPKLGCFWASGKGRDWFANWKQLILTCATIHRGWAQLYVTTCLQLHLSHVKTCKSKCMLHDYIIYLTILHTASHYHYAYA